MEQEVKELKIGILVATIFLAIIAIIVIQNTQGFTSISVPRREKIYKSTRLLLPQGWGFFTKSPRDEDFFLYSVNSDKGELKEVFVGPFSEPRNIFGIGRYSRSISVEYGGLFDKTPAKIWSECKRPADKCLLNKIKYYDIVNATRSPLICGKHVFVNRRPVPWSWAKNMSSENMPFRYIGLDVICNDQE